MYSVIKAILLGFLWYDNGISYILNSNGSVLIAVIGEVLQYYTRLMESNLYKTSAPHPHPE